MINMTKIEEFLKVVDEAESDISVCKKGIIEICDQALSDESYLKEK